jgi:hypothetical protein
MSKIKDYLYDLENPDPRGEQEAAMMVEERAKRVPTYIPVEPDEDGLPF